MGEIYRRITVAMWADDKFRQLSRPNPNAQSLWIDLLAGPATSQIPGLIVAGEAGMAEALGWQLSAFRRCWDEIASLGMARADWTNRVIWVPKAVRHNTPANPNVIRSWREAWDLVPDCPLKAAAWLELRSFISTLGKDNPEPWLTAFDESCRKPSAKGSDQPSPEPSLKGSRKGSVKTSAKGSPKQEQEQEQEKELPPARGGTPGPEGNETARERTTWLTEPLEIWASAYGGQPTPKKAAGLLKPVRDAIGQDDLCARLRHFVAVTPAEYATLAKFAETHGAYNCPSAEHCSHQRARGNGAAPSPSGPRPMPAPRDLAAELRAQEEAVQRDNQQHGAGH